MKRDTLFAIACFALLATTSCGVSYCKQLFPQLTQTTYTVAPSLTTPKGIHYDPSGLAINPALIDRLTDEVEACLTAAFPDGNILSTVGQRDDALDGAACGPSHHFTLPVSRSCLTVKVAADWHLSTDEFAGSKQQLLHDVALDAGADCGKNETGPGACYWRAGVQDKVTIVTTPSFYVFKQPLVEILTGCAFPWSSPTLTACMAPTTAPLSDGTGP
jgi:hypothetical protein